MDVSDVHVRVVDNPNDRLKAVCTVTFEDSFVVRDVKIVEGSHGVFVAMPSRKLSTGCPKCRCQNHVRAKFCNECGHRLPPARIPLDENGREKAHRDVAHPITAECREQVQKAVLDAYEAARQHVEAEVVEETVSEPHDAVETREEDHPAPRVSEPMTAEVELSPVGSGAEESPVESGKQVSDYDSMIADLRGGGGGGRRREPQRERAGASGRSNGSEGSRDRSRRGRRGGRGRGGRDSGESSAERGGADRSIERTQTVERTERKPAVRPADRSVEPREPVVANDEDSFAAGLIDEAPRRVPTPAPASPRETGTPCEARS
ncbi:MAG: septation protein SpoVG family protein, partial [Phycisphaerae bacterium]